MTRITVGKWDFRYIVGLDTIGIITQSRKKHIARIADLRMGRTTSADHLRVTPEEIADYIIRMRLA